MGIVVVVALALASAEPAPRLLVTELEAEGEVDPALVRLLGELLLSELGKAGVHQVIGGSDIRAMLTAEQQRQLAGCDEGSCLSELGGALGAELLASSQIGKVGDFYLLNLKILDVQRAAIVARWSEQVADDENALLEAIRRAVAAVTAPPGSAAIAAAPPPEQGLSLGWNRPTAAGGLAAGAILSAGASAFLLVRAGELHDRLSDKCPQNVCRTSAAHDRAQALQASGERHQRWGNVTLWTALLFGTAASVLFTFDELDAIF